MSQLLLPPLLLTPSSRPWHVPIGMSNGSRVALCRGCIWNCAICWMRCGEWSRKWRVALETKLTNGHLSCRLLLLLLLLLWLMEGMHKICDSCRHKYSSALSANALKVSPTGDNLFTTNHSRVWPSALVSSI